jgi:hypothetical protein
MVRYFIEQAPDRFYERSELEAAKARARRLSAKVEGGVYVIAEEYDADRGDYVRTGSIAFYGGNIDAREGVLA